MSQVRGMLSLDELASEVKADHVDTVLLAFPDLYGRLMGKRYDAGFFLEEAARHGSHACGYLLTVDMDMEPVPGYEAASWALGYGDFVVKPVMTSLRGR